MKALLAMAVRTRALYIADSAVASERSEGASEGPAIAGRSSLGNPTLQPAESLQCATTVWPFRGLGTLKGKRFRKEITGELRPRHSCAGTEHPKSPSPSRSPYCWSSAAECCRQHPRTDVHETGFAAGPRSGMPGVPSYALKRIRASFSGMSLSWSY